MQQVKTLKELAEFVGGKVSGDGSVKISNAATLSQAVKGDITFLANKKYENQLLTTNASAVVVDREVKSCTNLIISDDPYFAFREIVVLLHGHRKHKKTGISPKASVAETASIGKGCDIHDFATVYDGAKIGNNCVLYPGAFVGENTTIGDDCILYPNAVVFDNCVIGNRVIIQANASVGEDGFGFATHKGQHHKIPQIGRVIIEDDVEIGAGSGIERGALDDTIIGKGTKVGDMVAIGHGTKIGAGCLIVPLVGIAGSATVGNYCIFGGQSGVVGHIKIGNMVRIGAKAGVINDVADGKEILGTPAIDSNKARRAYALIETLPEMYKRIKELEKKLKKATDKTS